MEFWLISRPEVETPPALAALPGPYMIFFATNCSTASGVLGMFAPSATRVQWFLSSAAASAPSISFCVALGKAQSQGMVQGRMPSRYSAPNWSAYSLTRPRRTFFSSMSQASFSGVTPALS